MTFLRVWGIAAAKTAACKA